MPIPAKRRETPLFRSDRPAPFGLVFLQLNYTANNGFNNMLESCDSLKVLKLGENFAQHPQSLLVGFRSALFLTGSHLEPANVGALPYSQL